MNNNMICDYGCGEEAKFQFKNGKWCCSKRREQCIEERRKNRERNLGHPCSLETRKKMREQKIGEKNVMFGKKHTKESLIKIKEEVLKRTPRGETHYLFGKKMSVESCKKMSVAKKGKKLEEIVGEEKAKKLKELRRQQMLNGLALKCIKAIKKVSKPEIELRNMVKELYPNCEFQYPIFNFSIDVAIPEQKIAIEYDGYYHFDCKENIEYHKQRQQKIESEGWKFLRYTIYDKFPSIENLIEDLSKIIERKNNVE